MNFCMFLSHGINCTVWPLQYPFNLVYLSFPVFLIASPLNLLYFPHITPICSAILFVSEPITTLTLTRLKQRHNIAFMPPEKNSAETTHTDKIKQHLCLSSYSKLFM